MATFKSWLDEGEDLDNAGYWSLECWGGVTFDSCIRFLNEDPWERLRTFRKLMPKSRLQMLLRGQNLLGYRHYEDGVVERFVEKAAANGIDVFRIFDALNDRRNLKTSIDAVKKTGKLVLASDACERGSYLHTVASTLSQVAFDYLDAPMRRLTGKNTPIPYNRILERAAVPQEEDIEREIRAIVKGEY